MRAYAGWVSFFIFLLVSLGVSGGEEREVLRKEFPGGAKIRAVVRVQQHTMNVDSGVRAAVEGMGAKLGQLEGEAEFRIIYFTPAGSTQEVVARTYFVQWTNEFPATDGDERTYMNEFRTLDLAVAKDRVEILAHSRNELWVESLPLDDKGAIAKRGTITVLIDRNWKHRHEGYLPLQSALLKAGAGGSSVQTVSEEGKRTLWELTKGVAELKWMK